MLFHILTFGCQMNVADSHWLVKSLTDKGWQETSEEKAQVFILNTCSVREKPEQKVYSALGRIKERFRKNPEIFAAVGGCVAQQIGESFWARFPFIRLVFGPDGLVQAPAALIRLAHEPGLRLSFLDFTEQYSERSLVGLEKHSSPTAFVNIMQGCDNNCAYCIVPSVRGPQRSRKAEAILSECRVLLAAGAKEIVLLGQNVNSYGQDKRQDHLHPTFPELLRQVAALPGLDRLRFVTSHPKDLSQEVIKILGELETMAPSLHLPIQSGSDSVLQRMGRGYTARHYLELVHGLRKARPDIALTTDIIVGFPGETEKDFQATLDVMKEADFTSSFSFMYSDRPGVASVSLPDKIPQSIKAARLKKLQSLQEEISSKHLVSLEGKSLPVLVDGKSSRQENETTFWRGREPGGRVVNFSAPSEDELTGEMLWVNIIKAKRHSLWGEAKERY